MNIVLNLKIIIEYCHLTDKYSVNNNPLDLKQQPVNTFIYRLHKCTTILIEVLIIARENRMQDSRMGNLEVQDTQRRPKKKNKKQHRTLKLKRKAYRTHGDALARGRQL
jgi:hypothetical protein